MPFARNMATQSMMFLYKYAHGEQPVVFLPFFMVYRFSICAILLYQVLHFLV